MWRWPFCEPINRYLPKICVFVSYKLNTLHINNIPRIHNDTQMILQRNTDTYHTHRTSVERAIKITFSTVHFVIAIDNHQFINIEYNNKQSRRATCSHNCSTVILCVYYVCRFIGVVFMSLLSFLCWRTAKCIYFWQWDKSVNNFTRHSFLPLFNVVVTLEFMPNRWFSSSFSSTFAEKTGLVQR